MAAGTFLITFIITFLIGGDILRSLFLGLLIAIVTEIGLSKYKESKENPHFQGAAENKIKSEPIKNSAKIVNWKAILLGLAVSGILVVTFLFTAARWCY